METITLKLILFLTISCWLLNLSWKSLRTPGSHGFYRFFAWEAIVALILLNVPFWFRDPGSVLQIVSWSCLAISLVLLGPGGYHLLRRGKPATERKDDTLMDFEKTTVLVTSGIYGYIRHPLYGSLLFLAWGAFLKDVTWYTVVLTAAATWFLIETAKADEVECVRYFGAPYETYMRRTKMFIPFLF